jgi:endonuclease V-like protein UPF0215 family
MPSRGSSRGPWPDSKGARGIRAVKRELRILGIGAALLRDRKRIALAGVVFRGGLWLDGALCRLVPRDSDLAEALGAMVLGSKHFGQLRLIMLPGLELAGREIDPEELHSLTGLPVMAIADRGSEIGAKGGPPLRAALEGISEDAASRVLELTRIGRGVPEPLRVAALLARAIRNA